MNVRDLSALERTAVWLEELIQACRRPGPLYAVDPTRVADVTRKAKSLRTSLQALRALISHPEKREP